MDQTCKCGMAMMDIDGVGIYWCPICGRLFCHYKDDDYEWMEPAIAKEG